MAYRECVFGHLLVLDKHPGLRPVGVGETWRSIFANIVLKVTGPEAIMVCQGGQLFSGLNAVIDGAIHGVQALWDINSSTEEWVI